MSNFLISKNNKKSYEGKIVSSSTKGNKQYATKLFEHFTYEKFKNIFNYEKNLDSTLMI